MKNKQSRYQFEYIFMFSGLKFVVKIYSKRALKILNTTKLSYRYQTNVQNSPLNNNYCSEPIEYCVIQLCNISLLFGTETKIIWHKDLKIVVGKWNLVISHVERYKIIFLKCCKCEPCAIIQLNKFSSNLYTSRHSTEQQLEFM